MTPPGSKSPFTPGPAAADNRHSANLLDADEISSQAGGDLATVISWIADTEIERVAQARDERIDLFGQRIVDMASEGLEDTAC